MKLTGSTKSKLNLSIDIVMFILLVTLAGIGFLMKYVVVSGEVRNVIYGNQVELEFFGLTRHQWGSVHLALSITFLIMLALHIILHWQLTVNIYNCMFKSRFLRYGIAGFICLIGLVTLISPFILEPEKVPFEPQYRNRYVIHGSENKLQQGRNEEVITSEKQIITDNDDPKSVIREDKDLKSEEEHHNSEYDEYEVFGFNTLQDIANRYEVPVSVICYDLKIPENKSGEKLGWLRKEYGFTMTDVRKSIFGYKHK